MPDIERLDPDIKRLEKLFLTPKDWWQERDRNLHQRLHSYADRWTFVTDGAMAIAFDAEPPPTVKPWPLAASVFDEPDLSAPLTNAAGLKEWAGPPSWRDSCRSCRGTGRLDGGCCERCGQDTDGCEDCDSRGWNDHHEIRDGVLFGISVNRLLVARALDIAPSPPDTVGVLWIKASLAIQLRGKLWLATIMPRSPWLAEKGPKFPEDAP